MIDPFELLHDQLVAAAAIAPAPERGEVPMRVARVRRGRLTRRGLLPVVAALALAGTATAAVVTLTGEDSAPPRGQLRQPIGATLLDASRYEITMLPDLSAGHTGWCSTLRLRRTDGGPVAGTEACGSPEPGAPVITASTLLSTEPGGRAISYAVVPARIDLVRVGSREIIARRDTSLPFDWKIAVWMSPARDASAVPAFVDAQGAVVPYERSAQAPAATQVVTPAAKSVGVSCSIRISGGAHAASAPRITSARVASGPTAGTAGHAALFSCADATVIFDGRRYRAALLQASSGQTAFADRLLGAARRRASGRYRLPQDLTVRRVGGRGWVVVEGPTAVGRRTVLGALRATW